MRIREAIELANWLYFDKYKKHRRTIARRDLKKLFGVTLGELMNIDNCVDFLKKRRIYIYYE